MNQNLKKYIKSLSSEKKQKIYSLRREIRKSRKNGNCVRIKKTSKAFNIIDMNDKIVCIIPFINNSYIKTFPIADLIKYGINYTDTFYGCFTEQPIRVYNNLKKVFNEDITLDDYHFINGSRIWFLDID